METLIKESEGSIVQKICVLLGIVFSTASSSPIPPDEDDQIEKDPRDNENRDMETGIDPEEADYYGLEDDYEDEEK